MVNGPPCAACANPLRWIPESNGWGCDRCRQFYPAQQQAPQPAPQQAPPQQAYGAPQQAYGAPQQAYGQATPGQPYSPHPANYGAAQGAIAGPPAKKSKAILFGGIGAGVLALIIIIVVATRGGGGGSGSKEDVAKATIAALSSGDIDALMKVADLETAFTSALDCEKAGGGSYGGVEEEMKKELKQAKKKYESRIDDLKGAKLEFVEIVPDKDDEDRDRKKKKGDHLMEGCVAKDDLDEHRIKVKVKITEKDAKGEPYEQTVNMKIIQVGNRYFLERVSEIELEGGGAGEAVGKMKGFADRMCACKDKACAEGVSSDMTKWGTEMAKDAKMNSAKASDKMMKEMSDITKRFADCYMKVLSP